MAVSIFNTNSNTLLSGTKGNDTIDNGEHGGQFGSWWYKENGGKKVTIFGGAGNDLIYNTGVISSIFGEKGDDSIVNYGENVTISGGFGNDSIYNDGSYSSIFG